MGNCLPCFDRRAVASMDNGRVSAEVQPPDHITVRKLDDGQQVTVPIAEESNEAIDRCVALLIEDILRQIREEEEVEANATASLVIEELLSKVEQLAQNKDVTKEVTKQKSSKSRFRFFKRKSSKKAAEKAASACGVIGDQEVKGMVTEEEEKKGESTPQSVEEEKGEGEKKIEGPKEESNGPKADGAHC